MNHSQRLSAQLTTFGTKPLSCLMLPLFLCVNATALAATKNGQWQAGIGDPTIFGWITVMFYFIAMLICIYKSESLKKIGERHQFWLYLALFLLLLGINKQLDLQTWFTQTLRDWSQVQGWYEQRRPLQAVFIAALAVAIGVTLVSLRRYLADSWHHHQIVWTGIVLLSAFILMRAASFHHMDVFINHRWLGLRFNVLLEIGAILVVIVGALKETLSARINMPVKST